jgi:hypothetical protein
MKGSSKTMKPSFLYRVARAANGQRIMYARTTVLRGVDHSLRWMGWMQTLMEPTLPSMCAWLGWWS